MTMKEIEQLTADYAAARAALTDRVAILQAEIDALTRRELPAIRRAVDEAAGCHDRLRSALELAPALFEKPRTRVFSGVKVGYLTGKAKVEIPDEAETIRRIRTQLPEAQAELLIAVSERVDKRAVADLTTADIKRLRIRVEPGAEKIVIKPVDGAVDKIIAALLKDAERIEEAA